MVIISATKADIITIWRMWGLRRRFLNRKDIPLPGEYNCPMTAYSS
jgi:hypothetical protein